MSNHVITSYEVLCFCNKPMTNVGSGARPYFQCANGNNPCGFRVNQKSIECLMEYNVINLDVAQQYMFPKIVCPNEKCAGSKLYNYQMQGLDKISLIACSCGYKTPLVKIQLVRSAAKLEFEPNIMVKKLCSKQFKVIDESGREVMKPFFIYENLPMMAGDNATSVTCGANYEEE